MPLTDPLNVIGPIGWLLQVVMAVGTETSGLGFTVMVNVLGLPVQKVVPVSKYLGNTSIVASMGAFDAFVAGKEAISPLPLDDNPIPVLLFVHEYVVPVTLVPKVMAVVFNPSQTTWLLG